MGRGRREEAPVKTFVLIIPWMIMGGSIRCALDVMRVFKERGYRTVTIVTSEHSTGTPWLNLFEELSDEIHDLHVQQRTRRGHGTIRTLLTRLDPDVILINDSHEAFRALPMLRQHAPHAIISCLYHMILENWDFASYLMRWPDAWDVCLTVSSKLREELIEAGVDGNKIHACHWFGHVNIPTWSKENRLNLRADVRANLGIPLDARVVLFPFRLDNQKRPWMITHIASHLIDRNYWFIIAGDGHLEKSLKRGTSALPSKDRFRFLGRVDLDRMQYFYAASDVSVTPSQHEGIPLVYYECMELGIPVICSDVGAVSELVDNECASVIDLGNGDFDEGRIYAQEIIRLCEESVDRHGIVQAAKTKVAARFSYKQFWKRIIRLLEHPSLQTTPTLRSKSVEIPKVFVIGNPFTGEHALGKAFEELGYSIHRWDPILQDYCHHGNFDPIWDVCEQFDVFVDGPFNTARFYRELYRRFPDAKFVMTTRNRAEWEKDHRTHFDPACAESKNPRRYRLHHYDAEEWRKWYERRQNEIIAFFTEEGAIQRFHSANLYTHRNPWALLQQIIPGFKTPKKLPEFPDLAYDLANEPADQLETTEQEPDPVGRVRNAR